jgi:signal transduction histidine kinase
MPDKTPVAALPQLSARAVRVHELRNCLSVVLAVSSIIDRELSERGRERFARLRTAAGKIRSLIEEDLGPDRPEASDGRDSIIRIEDLVREVAGRVQECAERRRVRLMVTCGDGCVRGNRRLLTEALHNVVSNALQATPSGGAVRVTTRRTTDGDQEWVVQDTGSGMAPEQLRNTRRPNCTTRQGGSGLGVAVARDAFERHGGGLTIESEAGVGTRVQMWLKRTRT